MNETKHWWLSKTNWGVLVMIVTSSLVAFGVGQGLEDEQEPITELIMQIIQVGAGLFALYGRLTAKTILTT